MQMSSVFKERALSVLPSRSTGHYVCDPVPTSDSPLNSDALELNSGMDNMGTSF